MHKDNIAVLLGTLIVAITFFSGPHSSAFSYALYGVGGFLMGYGFAKPKNRAAEKAADTSA